MNKVKMGDILYLITIRSNTVCHKILIGKVLMYGLDGQIVR